MRRAAQFAAVAFIVGVLGVPPSFAAQPTSRQAQTAQSSSKPAPTQTQKGQGTPDASAAKSQSLGEAARQARQEEKNAPKAAMVFTNDNIPTAGSGVSVVGAEAKQGATPAAAPSVAGTGANDEAAWRKRFADARHKITQDESELSIMQRELGELHLQYYPDPSKALMQSVNRSDIIKKQNAITDKQKELDADKQALANLENELRKSGGDPGWARE